MFHQHVPIRGPFPLPLALAVLLGAAPAVSADVGPVTPSFLFHWGNQGSAAGQFLGPYGMAFDTDGNVYVADVFNSRVQKFDPLGNFLLQWGTSGAGSGQFTQPSQVATDALDDLYVVDENRVQKFTSKGAFVTQWSVPSASSIAVDRAGNVWVGRSDNGHVSRYSGTGTFLASWPSGDTPLGIAVDRFGTVYVSHSAFSRVRKFTSVGALLTEWGTGGSGNGQFSNPVTLALDPGGNVYVADSGNHRVQKFTSDGAFLGLWGTFGSGDGQFQLPYGVAVDPAGNVYVAELGGARVQKFSGSGLSLSFPAAYFQVAFGQFGSGNGQFSQPSAVTVRGDLFYVCDASNNRMQRLRTQGGGVFYVNQWGSAGSGDGQFFAPSGVATDTSGNVFVVDFNNRVQKFDAGGAFLAKWGSFGSGNGQFQTPLGVATDLSGNVYVADFANHRVQKFTGTGTFLTTWGSFGSGPGQFNNPVSVAIDAAGSVYVVDFNNSRVQKFTSSGAFITEWGSSGSGDGSFSGPRAIAVDPHGNVVVVDAGNSRVQLFTSHGKFLAKWGSSGAASGQFNTPIGVATDAAGNVYVADQNNHRLQGFSFPARIAMISDVGNDQGGQVRVRILRGTADAPGPSGGPRLFVYELQRKQFDGYSLHGSTLATGDPGYSIVAPTVANATPGAVHFETYRILSRTTSAPVFYLGADESGYSADNLTPPPPAAFAATPLGEAVLLRWEPSPHLDVAAYRVYRAPTPEFVPRASDLVIETPGTEYLDLAGNGGHYKLTAIDVNGNESAPVPASPGDPNGVAASFSLRGLTSNPAPGARLEVTFSLPHGGRAVLELVSVQGRRVLTREVGGLGPGWHRVPLGDEERIASGVYFVRLIQDGRSDEIKAVVLN